MYTYKTALKGDKEVESKDFFLREAQKATRESKPEAQKAAKQIEPEAKNSKSCIHNREIENRINKSSPVYKCTIGTKCSPKGFPKRKSERLLSVSPKANSIRQA